MYTYYHDGHWKGDVPQVSNLKDINFNTIHSTQNKYQDYAFLYKYPTNVIFIPQLIGSVDRDAQIFYYSVGDDLIDIHWISDSNIIRRSEKVIIKGAYNEFPFEKLLAAGTEYPDWVERHYLKIPKNL